MVVKPPDARPVICPDTLNSIYEISMFWAMESIRQLETGKWP